MNKPFSLLIVFLVSLSALSQQTTTSYFLVNGTYTNMTSDVTTSCYPILSANSEWSLGPKQLISVGFGGELTDMFTKLSAWSRQKTAGTYDTANYIAVGENGNSYTPGSFFINGVVGVGTTSPRARLDIGAYINDSLLGTVMGRLSEGDNTGSGTFLGVRGYATQGAVIYNTKSFAIEHNFYGVTNSSIGFYRGGNVSGGFMTFSTNANNEQMRITQSGNVGIGTTNPDQKLTVKGKIHAEEVIIDLNVPVADYVFAENYPLMPLHKVEQFVKINNHLPEIPSATEVKEKGLSLGEMQNKLLQKIEELTLYVIEQQKINEKQGVRIEELEKKVK